jgi:putative methionine-R-sulfoxide reductase with GAF domain
VSGGRLRAVLDLDSTHLAGFSRAEAETIHALLREVLERDGVVW